MTMYILRRGQWREPSKLSCIQIATVITAFISHTPSAYHETVTTFPRIVHFAHWWRPITPDCGVVWAVEIWLPPGPAYKLPEEKDGKTIELLDPPPAGQAAVLGIGFSRISAAAAALPVGVRNLGGSLLSTGDNVVVLAGNVPFDKEVFRAEVEPRINASFTMGHFLVSEDRILGSQHPRATIYNDPKVDGVLKIFDFGIAISRSR
jgi:hypothetical protein